MEFRFLLFTSLTLMRRPMSCRCVERDRVGICRTLQAKIKKNVHDVFIEINVEEKVVLGSKARCPFRLKQQFTVDKRRKSQRASGKIMIAGVYVRTYFLRSQDSFCLATMIVRLET